MKPNINDVVCAEFGVSMEELKMNGRQLHVFIPRAVIMWYNVRQFVNRDKIAAEFNTKRSNTYNSVKKINELIVTDKMFSNRINFILEQMKHKTNEQI